MMKHLKELELIIIDRHLQSGPGAEPGPFSKTLRDQD